MADDHALRALTEAREQLKTPIPDDLLAQILAVEQAHAFDDDQDVALREVDSVLESHLKAGGAM